MQTYTAALELYDYSKQQDNVNKRKNSRKRTKGSSRPAVAKKQV
jgi:hypothetical protein